MYDAGVVAIEHTPVTSEPSKNTDEDHERGERQNVKFCLLMLWFLVGSGRLAEKQASWMHAKPLLHRTQIQAKATLRRIHTNKRLTINWGVNEVYTFLLFR